MEGLTRLVTESLARHGFDRPLDYRRLHWSRWFRCESPHSLLLVPSKPGVFALAEEVMDFGSVGADAFVRPATLSEAKGSAPRRMLAVTQFFEDDDMAFVLDRMLSRHNPMRARLASGRFFVRFVVIEDHSQRRSICSALNQWIASSSEKASGIGDHFASSLELTPATEYIPSNEGQGNLFDQAANKNAPVGADAFVRPAPDRVGADAFVRPATLSEAKGSAPGTISNFPTQPSAAAPQLDSGAAKNIHCPTQLPSGF